MSSYVLEKDLLSSARVVTTSTSQNWIDVNSNTALLGSTTFYRTSCDAEMKKQIADLQDQLKMLKVDADKKDKLITELSSFKEPKHEYRLDPIFTVEKSTLEVTKRELQSAQIKIESLSNEISELKAKLSVRDDKINEIKREMDLIKNENTNMNSLIVTQRNKIKELESELNGFENVASKSGITITTLQKDNKQLQQTILELESRIRTHIMEREEAERKTETLYNKLNELASKITTITGIQITTNVSGVDILITKISDIVNESSMLKGKLMTTQETLTQVESENKANRETIQRLVNELNKFEKDSVQNKLTFESIKAERDAALTTKSTLEKEIETLKERVTTIQTAWTSTKTELDKQTAIVNGNNANVKKLEYDSLYAKNCLTAFKEQVAALLSDGFVKVDPNEEQIKEKIQLLMTSSKDRGLMIASMEGKIQQMANQLTEQVNIYKELEHKYHTSEAHAIELERKLKSLDSEYCATEVLRNNLKSDHLKYLQFLEQLGKILKIDAISADMGMDMNIEIIIARAEQLVKMESESIQDKQTNIYNLQRKVKQLKEQLDNKELHLDLLRKKLASLEEEKAGKCALSKEVDEHVMMSKKFKVKVDKLTEQLSVIKAENDALKAQLYECNGTKVKLNDHEKEISKLIQRVAELEAIKEKQSLKIAKLKEEIESANSETNKTRSSSDNVVHSLSQELRALKQELEKYKDRERQLLDFRNVIARMLGLDVSTLAVADYEIIARIERIIGSFNEGVMPVHIQPVLTQQQLIGVRMPATTTYTTVGGGGEYTYSSSSSSSEQQHRSQSPARHYHHSHSVTRVVDAADSSHHHHRSPSPSRRHHHGDSATRSRSKSPRKVVTIDPNSY